jgi:hypothetical protein
MFSMKRGWAVVVVLVLAMAGASLANEGDFGLRLGYQKFPSGGDGGIAGGAYFRMDWHRVLYWEVAALYHSESAGDHADLEQIPVQLSALLFFLRRDLVVSPYLLAGVGGYTTRLVREGQDTDSSFDFGWHLGGGCLWNLNDRIFIEGDARYVWLNADMKDQTLGDKLSDFNSWLATVGVGFRL